MTPSLLAKEVDRPFIGPVKYAGLVAMLLVDPIMYVLNLRILHQAILVIRVYCTYVPSSDPPPCTLYNVAVPELSCVWAPQEYSRLKYSNMRFLASKYIPL